MFLVKIFWGFGHTHFNADNVLQGTRVASNQCGYIVMKKKCAEGYDPSRVYSVQETLDKIEEWRADEAKRRKKEKRCVIE